MDSELIIVKEVLLAEIAIGMQENYIAKLVNVASLQMFVQLAESVQLLLL